MKKQTQPDLSIIVPVYNTGAFLATCLDSILSQTGVTIEVIIVNDGSTDDSAKIIREYEQVDERICSIYQRNQGLSVARNTGLKKATGEYILFVDSDDWILPDSLSYYVRLAQQKDVDVVVGKVNLYYDNGAINVWNYDNKLHAEQPTMSGEEYLSSIVKSKMYIPMVYGYICRRSLLEKFHLIFEPGLIHEDELWTPHMLLRAQSVTFGEIPHYAYRRRSSGSITSSTQLVVRLHSLLKITRLLSETFSTIEPTSPAYKFFIMDIRSFFRTCARIALRSSRDNQIAFENMTTSLPDSVQNDNIIQAMNKEYYATIASPTAYNMAM